MKRIDLVRHPISSRAGRILAPDKTSILAHRGCIIRDLDSGRPCAQPYLLSQLAPDNMLGPHVEPVANTLDCRLDGCIGKPAHQAQDPVCLTLRIARLFTLGLRSQAANGNIRNDPRHAGTGSRARLRLRNRIGPRQPDMVFGTNPWLDRQTAPLTARLQALAIELCPPVRQIGT